MTDSAMLDYEPAKIYNEVQQDFGLRVSTFTNHLLVLNAGILSITIGAFLGIKPPAFAPEALAVLRSAWWLLTISLVCALTSAFFVLAGNALVVDTLRTEYAKEETGPRRILLGPPWMRHATRGLILIAFSTCIAGIICISSAASQMLRIP